MDFRCKEELSSGCCTLSTIEEKKQSDGDTFFVRTFFGLQTSCTGAANLPLMSRQVWCTPGKGRPDCCENTGFNNIRPGSLVSFLQTILLRDHENS